MITIMTMITTTLTPTEAEARSVAEEPVHARPGITRERVSMWLAVLATLATYVYFGSAGRLSFPLVTWEQSYYASLTEGFLRGQLAMAHEPPARLAALQNPYSLRERRQAGIRVLYDAVYYEGKYQLYFSAVPAILMFLPVRLVFGSYPSEPLVTTVFASIAFLLFVLTLRRVLAGRRTFVPFWIWILALGIGNVIPYVLVRAAVYQVPIACALMFTAAWWYWLVRLFETRSLLAVAWMGLFVALAIASRPNLLVLALPAALALLVFRGTELWRKALVMFALPLLLVAAAAGLYNMARFGSPLQIGYDYMLTENPSTMCSLTDGRELARLANGVVHYLFWPPSIDGQFPFLAAQVHRLDPAISYRGRPEQVIGAAIASPLVLLGTWFALVLPRKNRWRDPRMRSGLLLLFSGWLVLLSLSSCAWVTARYSLDFVPLLLAGSVLTAEWALSLLSGANFEIRILRAMCVAAVIWSLGFGLLLPFGRGMGDREAPSAATRRNARVEITLP